MMNGNHKRFLGFIKKIADLLKAVFLPKTLPPELAIFFLSMKAKHDIFVILSHH